MKLLVIMKRFGTNQDFVSNNFGRHVRLFESLLKYGHEVDFLCPDHKKYETKNVTVNGINYYVRPYSLLRHFSFVKQLENLVRKNNYDVIVGTSDPLFGIMGYFYSKKFHVKHIYDMQDEYSCYASYKIPFIPMLDKHVIKNSGLALTVSDSLNKHVKKFRRKPTVTIQNGIELEKFRFINKKSARRKMRLPQGNIIIYTGEISKFKGVDTLIEAFKLVIHEFPETHLLLCGKIIDVDVKHKNIIYEHYHKRDELITALYASDVGIIPNKDNAFARYCFPLKLFEYMAANLKIVTTNLGDASAIVSKVHGFVCRPDDKYDMAEKLIYALASNKKPDYRKFLNGYTWDKLAKKLDNAIKKW